MEWYLKVLKQYAVFSGRARRKEYWMFVLFSTIVSFILGLIDGAMGTIPEEGSTGLLGGIYSLAIFIPSLAVGVRRLHDVGKSGWMLLLLFLPIIGWIWLLILHCTDSEDGENQYGPNPKGEY